MAQIFDSLTTEILSFIEKQKMFFISTAPTSEGEVNVSPKGYDTLRIINENRIIYLDYYGSGNETANHINENNRVTFMWCSFEEEPVILRAYGRGRVLAKETADFDGIYEEYFSEYPQKLVRQIFDVDIHKVQTSCGWAVPYMEYKGERRTLHDNLVTYLQK